MDLEEARELLSLRETDDAKTIRRAYMRAVKRHRPERDPDGFQRVRDAYALASSYARFHPPAPSSDEPGDAVEPGEADGRRVDPDPVATTVPRDPVPSAPVQPLGEGATSFDDAALDDAALDRSSRDEASREEASPDGPSPDGPSPDERSLDGPFLDRPSLDGPSTHGADALDEDPQWARLADLEDELFDGPVDVRRARLEEEVAAHPGDVELRRWLMAEHSQAYDDESVARLAREGVEAGDRGFLGDLARADPDALSDDELDWLLEVSPRAALPALIAHDRVDEALSLTIEAVRADMRTGYAYLRFPNSVVIDLLAVGDVEEARGLMARVQEELDTYGLAARLVDHDKVALLLLGELIPVHEHLPPEVGEALGDAVLDGDFERGNARLRVFSSFHRAAAKRAADLLAVRAPQLATLCLHALQPHARRLEGAAPTVGRDMSRLPLYLAAAVAIFGMNYARSCGSRSPVPSVSRWTSPPASVARSAGELGSSICRADASACPTARELAAALDARDCPRAEAAAPAVRHLRWASTAQSATPGSPSLRDLALTQLLAMHDARCAHRASPPPNGGSEPAEDPWTPSP